MIDLPAIPLADTAAVIIAIALWQGFSYVIERSHWAKISLTAAVNAERVAWMKRVTERENRVTDSSLIGNLMHSVSFFASTTVIITGAVAAMLGGVERSYDTISAVPFLPPVSKELFQVKLILLLLVFVYSFLKFTWSLRQFNYCCIVIGGAPGPNTGEDERAAFVARAARLNELGARSFNQGLRGYYFALACLGWFIHPLAFILAEVAVVLILWRREFHSNTRRALRGK